MHLEESIDILISEYVVVPVEILKYDSQITTNDGYLFEPNFEKLKIIDESSVHEI